MARVQSIRAQSLVSDTDCVGDNPSALSPQAISRLVPSG